MTVFKPNSPLVERFPRGSVWVLVPGAPNLQFVVVGIVSHEVRKRVKGKLEFAIHVEAEFADGSILLLNEERLQLAEMSSEPLNTGDITVHMHPSGVEFAVLSLAYQLGGTSILVAGQLVSPDTDKVEPIHFFIPTMVFDSCRDFQLENDGRWFISSTFHTTDERFLALV